MQRISAPLLSGVLLGGPALGIILGFAAIGPAFDFYKEHHYIPPAYGETADITVVEPARSQADSPAPLAFNETPRAPFARKWLGRSNETQDRYVIDAPFPEPVVSTEPLLATADAHDASMETGEASPNEPPINSAAE